MVNLELKPEEATALCEVLNAYLSDLSMEIAGTDSQDFRDQLKLKASFLRGVVEGLTSQVHTQVVAGCRV